MFVQCYWINNWDISNSCAEISKFVRLIWCKFGPSGEMFQIFLYFIDFCIWRVWFTYWYIIINRIRNRSWVHMNVITADSNQEEIVILVEVSVSSPAEEGIGLATTGLMIFPIRDVASKQFQFFNKRNKFYLIHTIIINVKFFGQFKIH